MIFRPLRPAEIARAHSKWRKSGPALFTAPLLPSSNLIFHPSARRQVGDVDVHSSRHAKINRSLALLNYWMAATRAECLRKCLVWYRSLLIYKIVLSAIAKTPRPRCVQEFWALPHALIVSICNFAFVVKTRDKNSLLAKEYFFAAILLSILTFTKTY